MNLFNSDVSVRKHTHTHTHTQTHTDAYPQNISFYNAGCVIGCMLWRGSILKVKAKRGDLKDFQGLV